jgi:hypothetical protein
MKNDVIALQDENRGLKEKVRIIRIITPATEESISYPYL